MNRRTGCWMAALLVALASTPIAGLAQADYPSKPVRLVVPFPSGFADVLARRVGKAMGDSMGQTFIIEQRPGGSGQIAAADVMKAPADGHTVFLIHIGTHAVNPHIYTKLNYDPERDFVPVIELARVPNLLLVSPSVPATTVQELVTLARNKPNELFFASPGNGTSGHLAGELFKSVAGVRVTHVPYKGAGETLQDLASGRVHMMFDTLAQGGNLARAGKVRGLAVTSAERHPAFPEYPTMAELGFKGWETGPWFGLAVKAGTPDAIVRRLRDEAAKALASPEVRSPTEASGATVTGGTSEAFSAFIKAESVRWGKLAREVGIRVDQ